MEEDNFTRQDFHKLKAKIVIGLLFGFGLIGFNKDKIYSGEIGSIVYVAIVIIAVLLYFYLLTKLSNPHKIQGIKSFCINCKHYDKEKEWCSYCNVNLSENTPKQFEYCWGEYFEKE